MLLRTVAIYLAVTTAIRISHSILRSRRPCLLDVAEEGVPFKLIAEAIGRQVGVPPKSLTQDEAKAHFGGLAMWVAGNGPASSEKTRAVLRWEPREVGVIADIERPDYCE